MQPLIDLQLLQKFITLETGVSVGKECTEEIHTINTSNGKGLEVYKIE